MVDGHRIWEEKRGQNRSSTRIYSMFGARRRKFFTSGPVKRPLLVANVSLISPSALPPSSLPNVLFLSLLLLLTAEVSFPSCMSLSRFLFSISHPTFPLRPSPMKILRSYLLLMMSSTSVSIFFFLTDHASPTPKACITAHYHRPATHERTSRHDRPCQRKVTPSFTRIA